MVIGDTLPLQQPGDNDDDVIDEGYDKDTNDIMVMMM